MSIVHSRHFLGFGVDNFLQDAEATCVFDIPIVQARVPRACLEKVVLHLLGEKARRCVYGGDCCRW